MKSFSKKTGMPTNAFTLVEILAVIAIISVLMTAGSIGLGRMGGKGVTIGVATAESLFDEARTTAVDRNLRACVLVAKTLTNNPEEDLRRIVVAYEETEKDNTKPNFGQAKNPDAVEPKWEISSLGTVLSNQTFFSSKFSQAKDKDGQNTDIPTADIAGVNKLHEGKYYIYEFNAQGISRIPGSAFIIGTGIRNSSRPSTEQPPKVIGGAKRDFGGFRVWRSGRTSVFRNPEQMGLGDPSPGNTF